MFFIVLFGEFNCKSKKKIGSYLIGLYNLKINFISYLFFLKKINFALCIFFKYGGKESLIQGGPKIFYLKKDLVTAKLWVEFGSFLTKAM